MSSAIFPLSRGPEQGLSRYLNEIASFPMLEREQEVMLAERWQQHEDVAAARTLITSHLRLVAKVAMGYRGYGLPVSDLISEGNIGLMQAVRKFDPSRGFRLATYAMWWIRSSIQEYVLRSWSLVRIGTSAAHKKLFFGLRRAKREIQAMSEGDLKPDDVREIADRLDVGTNDVVSMDRRLSSRDASLNTPARAHEGAPQWQDVLVGDDDGGGHVEEFERRDLLHARRQLLAGALGDLSEREQDILRRRRLDESPATLEKLSHVHGVSRERIRQIEIRAFNKVRAAMQDAASAMGAS